MFKCKINGIIGIGEVNIIDIDKTAKTEEPYARCKTCDNKTLYINRDLLIDIYEQKTSHKQSCDYIDGLVLVLKQIETQQRKKETMQANANKIVFVSDCKKTQRYILPQADLTQHIALQQKHIALHKKLFGI